MKGSDQASRSGYLAACSGPSTCANNILFQRQLQGAQEPRQQPPEQQRALTPVLGRAAELASALGHLDRTERARPCCF